MQSVYYLTHKDTGRRLKWYKTLTGARIAQRSRNHRLGFVTRVERIVTEDSESELCVTVDNITLIGTYTIVEDTVDSTLDSIVDHT
jgi:hypothetical protein